MIRVLVEIRVPVKTTMETIMKLSFSKSGFVIDPTYDPVPMGSPDDKAENQTTPVEEIVIIRVDIEEEKFDDLRKEPNIINVWTDARIEPF